MQPLGFVRFHIEHTRAELVIYEKEDRWVENFFDSKLNANFP